MTDYSIWASLKFSVGQPPEMQSGGTECIFQGSVVHVGVPPGLAGPPERSTTRAWLAQQQTGPPLGSVNPSYIMLSV